MTAYVYVADPQTGKLVVIAVEYLRFEIAAPAHGLPGQARQ
jgi:hypothetical protein